MRTPKISYWETYFENVWAYPQEEYLGLRESTFREDKKVANEELIIGNVQPIHKEVEFGWSLWYVKGRNVYRIVVQKLGM